MSCDVTFDIARITQAAQDSFQQAGTRVMQQVFDASQQQVPVKTGKLKASGKLEVQDGDIRVSYNTDYALLQHEDLSFHHNVGKAKYLEDPFNQIAKPNIENEMARAFNERLR